jgi:hypothetical protein
MYEPHWLNPCLTAWQEIVLNVEILDISAKKSEAIEVDRISALEQN